MESFCQIEISKDLGYTSEDDYESLIPKFVSEGKLLTSFKASILRDSKLSTKN